MKAQSGKTTCLSCKAQEEIKVSGCKYHKYRPDRNIEMQAQKKHHLEWEKPKGIKGPFQKLLSGFFPLRGGVPPLSAKGFWAG